MPETNLNKVKEVAIAFLYFDIEPSEVGALAVYHPILETGFSTINDNGKFEVINLLEDESGLKKIQSQIESRINKADDVVKVYIVIRKSYRLTFLKYIKPYTSKEDFSELLADAWVSSENPNGDVNVSVPELIQWFKEADKSKLMTEEDLSVYNSLPDSLTVYRGVSKGRNPQGISWTQNIETAEWFANRWGDDGCIQSAFIPKEKALAYFNTRDEDELVVDTTDLSINVLS